MTHERALAKGAYEGVSDAQQGVAEVLQAFWPFRPAGGDDEPENISFPVDICETEDGFLLVGEMPGLRREDIDIHITENELEITGRFRIPLERKENIAHREVPGADYGRAFTLSSAVDRDKVTAELKGGLLKVRLAKSEWARPREIKITG